MSSQFTLEYAKSIAGKCELYEAIREKLEIHIRNCPKSDFKETFLGGDFYNDCMPDISFIEELFRDFNCKLTIKNCHDNRLAKIRVHMDSKTWTVGLTNTDNSDDDYDVYF